MSKSGSRLFEYTIGSNRALVDELIAIGVKCSPDKILYILKDKDGNIIWLETGNEMSGLQHILSHKADFAKQGINSDELPTYIMEAIKQGNVVGHQGRKNPRTIFEFVYEGQTRRIAISIASNGYIVGANPK